MQEITTRAELINALRVAAELEHGLMAQYLFAVYSMKRYTYEDLDAVQLERVRRWSSSITLIARQEMEHLGLALNLLSAIGGTPSSPQHGKMNDLNQYGLDIINVSDLASARQAITMILEQGEGVAVNAGYLRWTHFCLFTKIRAEMEEFGLGKTAARPVVANPMTMLYPDVCPDDEVTLLKDPSTIAVAQLFNGSYE